MNCRLYTGHDAEMAAHAEAARSDDEERGAEDSGPRGGSGDEDLASALFGDRLPRGRPIFNGPDPADRYNAKRILSEHGFRVSRDDTLVLLHDATDADATAAGNVLLEHGFSDGVCW